MSLYASGHARSAASSAGLAATIAANTTLRRLRVGDARSGDAALVAFGPGLGAACSLWELDLEQEGLSAAGVRQLLADLQGDATLETLTLSRNDLALGGYAALASRLCCFSALCCARAPCTPQSLRARGPLAVCVRVLPSSVACVQLS